MKNNSIKLLLSFILITVVYSSAFSQTLRACDITTVGEINSTLSLNLSYEATSVINKQGKYECRYTDLKVPGRLIAIGLLESKIEFGNDLLKTEFETDKKSIDGAQKAVGRFTHFYAYEKGGPTAYYMTADKNDYSAESFVFKFRKGNYIVSFSSDNIPLKDFTTKMDAIYDLFKNVK